MIITKRKVKVALHTHTDTRAKTKTGNAYFPRKIHKGKKKKNFRLSVIRHRHSRLINIFFF